MYHNNYTIIGRLKKACIFIIRDFLNSLDGPSLDLVSETRQNGNSRRFLGYGCWCRDRRITAWKVKAVRRINGVRAWSALGDY